MPDERLPWRRSESIAATSSESVMFRPWAISFSPFQNASSRLTLVLCPAMTIERLTTGDFIGSLHFGPVLVEVPAGLGGAGLIEVTRGLRASMSEAIFRGVFLDALSLGSFAGGPEIDDFSHAWSRRIGRVLQRPQRGDPSSPITPTR